MTMDPGRTIKLILEGKHAWDSCCDVGKHSIRCYAPLWYTEGRSYPVINARRVKLLIYAQEAAKITFSFFWKRYAEQKWDTLLRKLSTDNLQLSQVYT